MALNSPAFCNRFRAVPRDEGLLSLSQVRIAPYSLGPLARDRLFHLDDKDWRCRVLSCSLHASPATSHIHTRGILMVS